MHAHVLSKDKGYGGPCPESQGGSMTKSAPYQPGLQSDFHSETQVPQLKMGVGWQHLFFRVVTKMK